ncbi:uncharacterized protein AMSG_08336 [Thecamonas trahens ATCC 50062]|uniref:Uncharacterized protein n=1 Tax=Thecamonas trahens ATCC 50062 TaxID=461836 RepID=A0A0L0DIY6_THETB|nr:hypothetical protein AMSG_08336 [Thecamonas trahens ATCC 50062]KNC52364.1 hypothetical protein AMSG_08336 [Thecamonas trahens ATCC 50062]|eukprot:XP_013755413.1 hypothetical protein AMSG_08336 [Thecamonas trahens ATCC 50062]
MSTATTSRRSEAASGPKGRGAGASKARAASGASKRKKRKKKAVAETPFSIVISRPPDGVLYVDPQTNCFLDYRLYLELLMDKKRGGPKTACFPTFERDELKSAGAGACHFESYARHIVFFKGGLPRFRRMGREKHFEWIAPRGAKQVLDDQLSVQYRRRQDRKYVFRKIWLAADGDSNPEYAIFHCLEVDESNRESLTLKKSKLVEKERIEYLARVEAVKGEKAFVKARERAMRAAHATQVTLEARAAGLPEPNPATIVAAVASAQKRRKRRAKALAEKMSASSGAAKAADESKPAKGTAAFKKASARTKSLAGSTKVVPSKRVKSSAPSDKTKRTQLRVVLQRPSLNSAAGGGVVSKIAALPEASGLEPESAVGSGKRRVRRRRVRTGRRSSRSSRSGAANEGSASDSRASLSSEDLLANPRLDGGGSASSSSMLESSAVHEALIALARSPGRSQSRKRKRAASASQDTASLEVFSEAISQSQSMQAAAAAVMSGGVVGASPKVSPAASSASSKPPSPPGPTLMPAANTPSSVLRVDDNVLAIEVGTVPSMKRRKVLTGTAASSLAALSSVAGGRPARSCLDDDTHDDYLDEPSPSGSVMFHGERLELLDSDSALELGTGRGFQPASSIFRGQIRGRVVGRQQVVTKFPSQEKMETLSQTLAKLTPDPSSPSPDDSLPSAPAPPPPPPLALDSPPPSPRATSGVGSGMGGPVLARNNSLIEARVPMEWTGAPSPPASLPRTASLGPISQLLDPSQSQE